MIDGKEFPRVWGGTCLCSSVFFRGVRQEVFCNRHDLGGLRWLRWVLRSWGSPVLGVCLLSFLNLPWFEVGYVVWLLLYVGNFGFPLMSGCLGGLLNGLEHGACGEGIFSISRNFNVLLEVKKRKLHSEMRGLFHGKPGIFSKLTLHYPRFLRIIYRELAKFDSSNNSGASGMNSGILRQRMESA